ncbi:MAG: bifunctional hydroxymethylpyrimidine kinase/phosphomethylpyrimidine kinase [Maribacter sp.]
MENIKTPYQSVLSIAGSDSGGCAGIQADIKSISACGAYAATVITATTAQNTSGVTDIHAIPIPHLEKQLDAVLSDIKFGAVKIGMLHSCEVINVVQEKLKKYNSKNIVLDPVMVSTSGHKLIADDAISCLKTFLPHVDLITPNIPEAELLIDERIDSENMEEITKKIGERYQTSVLLKGGHIDNGTIVMTDVFYIHETKELSIITNPRVNTKNIHGTGCSLSSSIAAFLSLGKPMRVAIRNGCNYVNQAIIAGQHKTLGLGNGPINHFGL